MAKGGFRGPMGGGMNMNMIKQAQKMQQDMLKMQEEPIVILAALGSQLRRLYTARLALDSRKDKLWLMDLWNMRSDYPVRLLLDAARKTRHEWCANSLALCQKLDRRMKLSLIHI